MIMRIAGRPVGGPLRIIEIAGMIAPDSRQQPVQWLDAITPVPRRRRPIGLRLAKATCGGQQNTRQNYGKNMRAHGVFVRPGT